MTIARLDFSKPPPGYTAPVQIGEEWHVVGPQFAENFATEAAALAGAWVHHEAHNDPPGMWAGQARGEHEGGYGAWYKRRLALAEKLERLAAVIESLSSGAWNHDPFWPRVLTWTDEQVADVERWLADGGKLPEVLQ